MTKNNQATKINMVKDIIYCITGCIAIIGFLDKNFNKVFGFSINENTPKNLIHFFSNAHLNDEALFLACFYSLLIIFIITTISYLILTKERKIFMYYHGIFILIFSNAFLEIIANNISEFEYWINFIISILSAVFIVLFGFEKTKVNLKSKIINIDRLCYLAFLTILIYSFLEVYLYRGNGLSLHMQYLAVLISMSLLNSINFIYIYSIDKNYFKFLTVTYLFILSLAIRFYFQNISLIYFI